MAATIYDLEMNLKYIEKTLVAKKSEYETNLKAVANEKEEIKLMREQREKFEAKF